jgi:hypothetical protein
MMVKFIVVVLVLTYGFVRCATPEVIDGFLKNIGVLEIRRKVENDFISNLPISSKLLR